MLAARICIIHDTRLRHIGSNIEDSSKDIDIPACVRQDSVFHRHRNLSQAAITTGISCLGYTTNRIADGVSDADR